jgi:anti-sigma factor RsiW
VSHLREQISALIDGELTGAELDRANAHLAACGRCRAEAAALRQLKRELRALAGPVDQAAGPRAAGAGGATPGQDGSGTDDALTRRLLAMAGPGGPVPSRRFRREQSRSRRREQGGGRPGGGRNGAAARTVTGAGRRPPADLQRPGRPPREPRRRGRYMVFSAVSLVVVGIGAAAFSIGGATAEPGPKITPQLEQFMVEHALMSGDVPFPDPTRTPTARP